MRFSLLDVRSVVVVLERDFDIIGDYGPGRASLQNDLQDVKP